ncbi:MAG: hypothetical protein ACOX75_03225 [Lachnospiraceae bacterium]|jgi:uncharacterized membrane protein
MISKLEKRIGKYAIKNLIYYILGGYVIGYIIKLTDTWHGLYRYIVMDPSEVVRGQVWRLFTWILTPPQEATFFVIFMFLLYFFIGRALEQTLGAFRYNLYMISGWFFMTAGAMLMYGVTYAALGPEGAISINITTYYINMASFLAFAVLYPDMRVYFFGILPIKIKIIAWIDVGYMGLQITSCLMILIMTWIKYPVLDQVLEAYGFTATFTTAYCISQIFSIVISMLNFLIFFLANRKVRHDNARRKADYAKKAQAGERASAASTGARAGVRTDNTQAKKAYRPQQGNGTIVHRCTVCGRTSIDYPDLQFRYCSKCSGNHEYCQDHLFTHEHIK